MRKMACPILARVVHCLWGRPAACGGPPGRPVAAKQLRQAGGPGRGYSGSRLDSVTRRAAWEAAAGRGPAPQTPGPGSTQFPRRQERGTVLGEIVSGVRNLASPDSLFTMACAEVPGEFGD
jgi:hypothetical protein